MYTPVTTNLFEKDLKRALKRRKSLEKLQKIMETLCLGQVLSLKHCDHILVGNFEGRRECHIEPDWLLIYKKDYIKKEIIFERTGSHADLFG